jgi:hypothetical protein
VITRAEFIHIRWRFNKSKFNFIVEQYQRQRGTPLCPVKRAISIIRRALRLGTPCWDAPLGVFTGANQQVYTIQCPQLLTCMHTACIRTTFSSPTLCRSRRALLWTMLMFHNKTSPSDYVGTWTPFRDGVKHIRELRARTVVGVSRHAAPGGPPIPLEHIDEPDEPSFI